MNWFRTLEERYNNMNMRWSTGPQAQPEAVDNTQKCLAIWTRGQFHLTTAVDTAMKTIKTITTAPHIDYVATGNIHHTIFQAHTFPCVVGAVPEQVLTALPAVFRATVALMPPYHLEFTGLVLTKQGIALRGYTRCDYNRLRDALRDATGPHLKEPHKQDIHHVTLLRWLEAPTAVEFAKLVAYIEAHLNTAFGVLWPTTWEFGYGTWTMDECIVLDQWPATPAPHILHRGNTHGPCQAENNPVLLKSLLEQGWDVEMDLWIIDGMPWLGHDGPQYELTDWSILNYPGSWVHCKNIAAVVWCATHAKRYFSHDKDPAVLVSDGTIWFYPGVKSASAARAVYVLHGSDVGKGCCSDWLSAVPQHI